MRENLHSKTVAGFGDEWERFDQSSLDTDERHKIFSDYFEIFPWQSLPREAVGFDLGCGSGRWAQVVAPRVSHLHCVDPSSAIKVARRNLAEFENVTFHNAGVDQIPLLEGSMDFGYSLGVLHHIPDTLAAMKKCTAKLKPGAPFLIYLYYAFDNRPLWYRLIWRGSELVRSLVSRLPHSLRYFVSQLIAVSFYLPIARLARLGERLGLNVTNWPLAYYRELSFYTMRTDALDRFGTSLEQRFTKDMISDMMVESGLTDIRFSSNAPFWCAVGNKTSD